MLEQIFADIRFLPHRGTMPSTPRKTSFLGEEPLVSRYGRSTLVRTCFEQGSEAMERVPNDVKNKYFSKSRKTNLGQKRKHFKTDKKIRRGLRETTQCLLSNGIREICEIRA